MSDRNDLRPVARRFACCIPLEMPRAHAELPAIVMPTIPPLAGSVWPPSGEAGST